MQRIDHNPSWDTFLDKKMLNNKKYGSTLDGGILSWMISTINHWSYSFHNKKVNSVRFISKCTRLRSRSWPNTCLYTIPVLLHEDLPLVWFEQQDLLPPQFPFQHTSSNKPQARSLIKVESTVRDISPRHEYSDIPGQSDNLPHFDFSHTSNDSWPSHPPALLFRQTPQHFLTSQHSLALTYPFWPGCPEHRDTLHHRLCFTSQSSTNSPRE